MNVAATKKTAFVTGATGCIGRALTLKLVRDGWRVVALVRGGKSESYLNEMPDVEIAEGSLAERTRIAEAMRNCQVVFHLAAKVHTAPNTPAEEFFSVNVEGTQNIVAAAVENRVERFVFFSTVAVYPERDDSQDESSLTDPATVYGASKLEAERIVMAADVVKPAVLRLPVVYGPGDRGNVSKLIEAIRRGRYLIIGDGRNLKSMISVENAAEAALLVASDNRSIGQTYIVTDERPYSQLEIAETIADLTGRKRPSKFPRWPLIIAGRMADLASKVTGISLPISTDRVRKLSCNTCFCAAKIERELGFKPRVTLREGLAELIKNESNF